MPSLLGKLPHLAATPRKLLVGHGEELPPAALGVRAEITLSANCGNSHWFDSCHGNGWCTPRPTTGAIQTTRPLPTFTNLSVSVSNALVTCRSASNRDEREPLRLSLGLRTTVVTNGTGPKALGEKLPRPLVIEQDPVPRTCAKDCGLATDGCDDMPSVER